MKIKVELDGRDFIEVECEGETPSALGRVLKVSHVGCTEFMDMMKKMRRHFGADISKWPVPEGQDHSSLLLREMVLRLRGEWQAVSAEVEVCHCRGISAHTIDQAIIAGAFTPEVVTRQTSASAQCGTCRPEVHKMIQYRLNQQKAS
jgi:bacterioferritin-associated ferredoxin